MFTSYQPIFTLNKKLIYEILLSQFVENVKCVIEKIVVVKHRKMLTIENEIVHIHIILKFTVFMFCKCPNPVNIVNKSVFTILSSKIYFISTASFVFCFITMHNTSMTLETPVLVYLDFTRRSYRLKFHKTFGNWRG